MKKIWGIILVIMLFTIFVPNNVYAAKTCENFNVEKCPISRCKVVNNKCVTEHVGDDFCEQKNILKVMKAAGYLIILLKFAIPILIVLLGTVDIFKAVTAGTTDSLGKQAKSLGIRVAIGILIFFIPTIVDAFIGDNKESSGRNCQICVLEPGSTDCITAISSAK